MNLLVDAFEDLDALVDLLKALIDLDLQFPGRHGDVKPCVFAVRRAMFVVVGRARWMWRKKERARRVQAEGGQRPHNRRV